MYLEKFNKIGSELKAQIFTQIRFIDMMKRGDELPWQENEELKVNDYIWLALQQLGELYYQSHKLEQNFIDHLLDLKKNIEDYDVGIFKDWLEPYYESEADRRDVYQVIIDSFIDRDTGNKNECCTVPDDLIGIYEKAVGINKTMLEGLVNHFPTATILKESDGYEAIELSEAEKSDLANKAVIEGFETQFNLSTYATFVDEIIDICKVKGDLSTILHKI